MEIYSVRPVEREQEDAQLKTESHPTYIISGRSRNLKRAVATPCALACAVYDLHGYIQLRPGKGGFQWRSQVGVKKAIAPPPPRFFQGERVGSSAIFHAVTSGDEQTRRGTGYDD